MPLNLYDTLSREIQEVFAMDGESVRFYGCGPRYTDPRREFPYLRYAGRLPAGARN